MIDKGAKNLVLISRSGDKDPVVRDRIEDLRKNGAKVLVFAVDVSDTEGMKKLLLEN